MSRISLRSTVVFGLAAALALPGAPGARAETLHLAPDGNDSWSGKPARPLPDKTDGPLATLAGARNAIRRLKSGGALREPVKVVVAAGTYRLQEPLVLEPEDSGTAEAPITYSGVPGSRPVLSGGKVIRGFRKEGKLWVAELPEWKNGGPGFGALWVNGARRTRARMPNQGYFVTAGKAAPARDPATGKETPRERAAFRFQPGDIKPFRNLPQACVVVYHSWETSIHRIASIEADSSTVVFTGPAAWPFENWGARQRYHIENVPEALDAPGEWYLDTASGVLSYLPIEGEDPAKAEVIAPSLKQLVLLLGRPAEGRFVEHVHFQELRFLHTDWVAPPEGHSDSQAAFSVPGAIQATGAVHCSIRRSEIAHLATYGVWLRAGCREDLLEGNEIHDLGAGGVRIGEGANPPSDAEAAGHNAIENNFIHDGGKVFSGGVGVWIGRSSFNRVAHNEVSDFDYTGMSVGWSWGYDPSSAHHNVLEENHIHHIGRGVLNDMGAIYTLGVSPGTVERHNLMHDIECYVFGGWGVYTDEGSSGILIEDNIVYSTSSGCFHQHYGKENVLRNNVFAFGKEGVLRRSREEDHSSFTFERNLVLSRGSPFLITAWSNGRYRIDQNLYWDYQSKEPRFFGMSFAEWQGKGRDPKSLLADPLCEDAERFDFRLKAGSPAAKIGFRPIELKGIGLMGDAAWTEAPKQLRRSSRSRRDHRPAAARTFRASLVTCRFPRRRLTPPQSTVE